MDSLELRDMRRYLSEVIADGHVRSMRGFVQHGRVTTYQHCARVALLSYRLNRRLHLGADLDTLLKGAMLHDLFLYDWHVNPDGRGDWHGFRHARAAACNAEKYLKVNDRIRHVIEAHMWPLNITHIPHTREAWIVCLADKYASLAETLFRRK